LLKTHSCGELRPENIGQRVTLAGWVNRRRDHGNLIFIDLRDREGITQVVFNPELAGQGCQVARAMRSEYVVRVSGEVSLRPPGTENAGLATGAVEIIAAEAEILNASLTPPFDVNKDIEVDENLRLRYRYLDIRRQRTRENLRLRHRVVKFMRDFLDARNFMEVETPVLIMSTPEGARDYLAPSRLHPGKFYALPQSPQQLKQLLMVGGMERYYQVARCFRDEDTRTDRQPEFTQLDLEMSFVEEEDILQLTEQLFTAMIAALKPEIKLTTPFPRLSYQDALNRYGTDKPDLRFALEIADLSDIVAASAFGIFREAVSRGGRVKGICLPGCAGYTRHQLDDLNGIARENGAAGLVTIAISASAAIDRLLPENVKSSAARFLSIDEIKRLAVKLQANPGDLLLLVAGGNDVASIALGALRREMGRRLGLAPAGKLAFAFVVDFPLFTGVPGKLEAAHHPFTSPRDEDLPLLDTAPEKVRAQSYDLICNGLELGSGSIRIHHSDLQRKVFRLLGYADEVIDERFGRLLEAFDYGAPPHGGIAPGIDRVVMLLAGEETIREVIAFPKNQNAVDLTMGAPSVVTGEQLAELHIRVVNE